MQLQSLRLHHQGRDRATEEEEILIFAFFFFFATKEEGSGTRLASG